MGYLSLKNLLISFITVLSFCFIYVLFKSEEYEKIALIIVLVIILLLIIICVFSLLLKNLRNEIFISLLSVILSFYIIDIFITVRYGEMHSVSRRAKKAREYNIPFDERSKFQVILDNKKNGLIIHPSFAPKQWINEDFSIIPLSGISNDDILMGNESGIWIKGRTDKYGFNNPNSIYDNDIDIILIGDSWTFGTSVNYGETFSGLLTQDGISALNLGQPGTGPLAQYAIFKEYTSHLKPKYIFWFFFEGNDLSNLNNERNISLFNQYLDNDFSQDLINKQGLIDSILVNWYEKKYVQKVKTTTLSGKILRLIKLYNLRFYLNLSPRGQPKKPDIDFELFNNIIEKFKTNSEKIGAELVFVYLPSPDYFKEKKEDQFEVIILELVKQNNIKYINLIKEFSSPIDFNRIFFWDNVTPGHCNKNGHKMIYNKIKNFIE